MSQNENQNASNSQEEKSPSLSLKLVTELAKDKDSDVRATAINVLGRLLRIHTTLLAAGESILFEAIKDKTEVVRRNAVYALAGLIILRPELGETALETLLEITLKDDNEKVRIVAVDSIIEVIKQSDKGQEIFEKVIQELRKTGEEKREKIRQNNFYAILEIAKIKKEGLKPVLLPFLQKAVTDKSPKIRNIGLYAIIEEIKERPQLIKEKLLSQIFDIAVNDNDPWAKSNALYAIRKLTINYPELVENTLKPALKTLISSKEKNNKVRQSIINAISELPTISPASINPVFLDYIGENLNDKNSEIRKTAYNAAKELICAKINNAKTQFLPILFQALEAREPDQKARIEVLNVLTEITKEETDVKEKLLSILKKQALKGKASTIKTDAVYALVKLSLIDSWLIENFILPILLAHINKDEDEEVRAKSVKIIVELAKNRPEIIEQTLLPLATQQATKDPSSEVRKAAIETIGDLIKISPSLSKLKLLHAILVQAMGDGEEQVRESAYKSLKEYLKANPSLVKSTLSLFETTLKEESVLSVRISALNAFIALIKSKALPADMIEPSLIEIIKLKAKKEKNENEKAHAIKAIGTIIPLVTIVEKQDLTSLLIEKIQDKSSLIRKTTLLELIKLITPSYKTKHY